MSRVLIKDIAKALGISTATVSIVLSGKYKEGRVSKTLAQKVIEKAEEMDYKPNSLARSLRVGKTNTIGLIVADISNPFFASLAFYIQANAEDQGYIVIIANTSESDKKLNKMVSALKSRQVDGLIIVPTANSANLVADLANSKIPLVLLDRTFQDMPISHVLIDNYQASRKAILHLIGKGCKRIALFIYDSPLLHMQERERGYASVLKEYNIYDESLVKKLNYDSLEKDVNREISCMLKNDEPIDGVFFATNSISLLGIRALYDKGIQLSTEVNVVCFDKNDAFDFAQFKIPYISQPIAEMGRLAVESLINQINDPKASNKMIVSASLENI